MFLFILFLFCLICLNDEKVKEKEKKNNIIEEIFR